MSVLASQSAQNPAHQKLKVLVIDDDHEDVDYLRRLLRRAGCQHDVLEANSIDQGLAQLELQPDVVLLDYFLGACTGLEFLERLEPGKAHPPIIMLTGADDCDVDHGALAGALADYLPKKNLDGGMLTRSLYYAHRDALRVRQLEYLAHYDPLTGLCNRRLFIDRLEHAFQNVKRHHYTGALLYIDIDGFKGVNDRLGHAAGDSLLKEVAERMRAVVRNADTAARLGGDEFVILLENITIAEAHWVAQKLLSVMDTPVLLGDSEIKCSLSIGLCAFSEESVSAHHILVNADRALYQAKIIGKHTYCSFNKRLMDSLAKQQRLESIVHQVVQNRQFELEYTPILASDAAALYALQLAVKFPLSDELEIEADNISDLIVSLGWMDLFQRVILEKCFDELLAQYHSKHQVTIPQVPIAIRLSAALTGLDELVGWMLPELRLRGLNPKLVIVELEERLIAKGGAAAIAALNKLAEAGVQLVLVDFGARGGSLQALTRIPLAAVSISQAWLNDAVGDPRQEAAISALQHFSKSLGINLLAWTQPGEVQPTTAQGILPIVRGTPSSIARALAEVETLLSQQREHQP